MRELVLLVKVLGKVDEDRGGLEDREPFVCYGGDASVGVDLEEPRRLDLVVDLANVRVANAHSDFSTRDRLASMYEWDLARETYSYSGPLYAV